MRILYIANDLAYFRAHRENIALAMSTKGHEVFVAAGEWQDTDISDWPSNMDLIRLELNRHRLDIKSDIRLVQKLREIVKSVRPDIIHAITIKPILMCSVATGYFRKDGSSPNFKMVWTFPGLGKIFEPTQNSLKLVRNFIVKRVLKSYAQKTDVNATFENTEDRDLLVKQLGLLPENTHVLFGAGISFEQFRYNAESRHNDDTKPVFFMATRLIKGKGVDVFLEAAAALKDHPARPRFVLAGTRDLSNPDCVDQEIIDKSVAAGHIEFLGPIAPKEMPSLYQKAHVFCLPTRLREGFPRSLIEAAACGCALIASDQKSTNQVVKPQETGWLLQRPDRGTLVNTMKAVLSDPHATKLMGERAHKLVLNMQASNRDIICGFERIYDQIVQGHNLLENQ